MPRQHRLSALALAVAFAALSGAPSASAKEVTITIANLVFSPAKVTVSPGDTVTFVNEDDMIHSVVASDGGFHSDGLDTHDKVSFSFAHAGVFAYFCGLHPFMKGEIDVR